MSKKIIVSDGNGKHQEISENYVSVDIDNSSISASVLIANTASIPNSSTNKPVFIQNNVLTAIPDPSSPNKLIKYTNADGFTYHNIDNSSLQGDLSGSFPTGQIKVTSVANVTGGILPLAYGGLGTGSYTNAGLITTNGSFNLKSDNSINANQMTLVKGAITTAPAGLFGGNALSSSYDANSANYTGHVTVESHRSDYTVECWSYLSNVGGTIYDISRSTIFVTNNYFAVNIGGSTQFGTIGKYCVYTSTADNYTNLDFIANQWVHIALVVKENKLQLFVNGTGSASTYDIPTQASRQEHNKLWLGGINGNWNPNGFISEVSYVKRAKSETEIKEYYNAVRSGAFTRYNKNANYVSSFNSYKYKVVAPLTASATSDISINNNAITTLNASYATPPVASPFSGNALLSSYGGTSGQYSARVSTSAIVGDFTAECWVYPTNYGSSADNFNKSFIFSLVNPETNNAYELGINSTGVFNIWNGSLRDITASPSLSISLNTWQHIALVKRGSNLYIYKNGVSSGARPVGVDFSVDKFFVGSSFWGNACNGYLTEFLVTQYAKSDKEILNYYNAVIADTQNRINTNDSTANFDTDLYVPSALANLTQNPGHGPNRVLKYNSSNVLETVSKSSIEQTMLTEPVAYLYTGSIATNNTAQVDSFVWTKPKGCRFVKIYCQAAGGAGANAHPGSSGTAYTDGFYGGGGGGLSVAVFNATTLPDTVNVYVGRGGYVNPTISTTPPVNGKGGNSWFGDSIYLIAYGGTEGYRASTNSRPGYGGVGYPYNGGNGSNRLGAGDSVVYGGAGGGGGGRGGASSPSAGGSITTENSLMALNSQLSTVGQTGKLITSNVFTKHYLNNTLTYSDLPNLLCAGGYGGVGITGEAGISPTFGSGGGGGGDSTTAGLTGTGGNGGKGYVLIICY